MNITRAWTNERFLLPIDLTTWVAVYPSLPVARVVAQIRTAAASPVILFAWDTQHPPVGFEGNTVRFTASCLDTEEHGRFVYATLMLTPDKIAPYVPPKVAEPVTEK